MSRRKHTGVQEWPPHSGQFRIDYYTPDGKRHRPRIGSEKRAIKVLKQRKAEILLGKYQEPRRQRKIFSEVMAEYLESKQGLVSYYTQYNNKIRAGILEPLLGHELIDKIDAHLLNRVLAAIKNRKRRKPTAGGTVNRYRALLSGIFNFALDAKYIDVTPVSRKTVERYPQSKGRVRYASADEEIALRKAMRKKCPWRELEFDLALFTGLRKTEQYTARWSKVDLENRFMTVLGKSKGGIVERTIPLNPMAEETLEKLYLESAGSSYVIRGRSHRARKDREGKKDERDWFDSIVEAAGVQDFHWHDLRHTFASRAVMRGVPLRTVMKWMGHKDIATTMIYSHLEPGHEWEEMKKIIDTRNDTDKPTVLYVADKKQVK